MYDTFTCCVKGRQNINLYVYKKIKKNSLQKGEF